MWVGIDDVGGGWVEKALGGCCCCVSFVVVMSSLAPLNSEQVFDSEGGGHSSTEGGDHLLKEGGRST